MSDLVSIGTIARRSGVTRDTIRYYERIGLLPKASRTAAGYRQYDERTVRRLALIRHAQQFGFSLQTLRSFLRVRDAGGKPCHDVHRAAAQLLEAVDRQIADLVAHRDEMRRTVALWAKRLAETPPGARAFLLESFEAPAKSGTTKARHFRRR